MYVRRDYSQPIFGSRRKKRFNWRWLLALAMILFTAAAIVYEQRNALEVMVMTALGNVPEPTAQPVELATRAMESAARGDLPQAARLFEQALAMRPDNLDFMYEYGLILVGMARYDQAIALGDEMIRLSQFDPRGYTLKARALVWDGQSSAALPVALAGMEVDRQFSPLYAVIARAYVATGNIRAGLENGEMAVRLDPLNADARRSYAFALNNAAAYDEAIEQLEIAESIDPRNVDVKMELAGYYLWRDRDEEAINLYNSILASQPRNARAMLRLCDAYRKIGQFDVALGHCEDAADTDPSLTVAQLRYGLLLYSRREFARALPYFQRCVDNAPDNVECLYRLGLTHYYLYLGAVASAENLEDPAARDRLINDASSRCDTAWDHLQDSLLMAQNRSDTATLENIRLGLGLVSRDCPAYRGAAIIPPELLDTPPAQIDDEPLDIRPVTDADPWDMDDTDNTTEGQ